MGCSVGSLETIHSSSMKNESNNQKITRVTKLNTPNPNFDLNTISSILGFKFYTENNSITDFENTDLKFARIIGIYFSAHWCPPCRQFTPKLANFYRKVNSESKQFEVIFVTSDKNESQFKDYFKIMPWIAVPYNETTTKNSLKTKYNVKGIPKLVVIDPDNGKLITENGRGDVDKGRTLSTWKNI